MRLLHILPVFLTFSTFAYAARILGVFPNPEQSNFVLAEKLMLGLTKKGHEVTVISPFAPVEAPRLYKTISTASVTKQAFAGVDLFATMNQTSFSAVATYLGLGVRLANSTLSEPEVQKLINSNTTYDLVIVEELATEALLGFANHFKAPLVIFSSTGASQWTNDMVGDPGLSSYIPHVFAEFSSHMNFLQRTQNLALSSFDLFFKHFISLPEQDLLLKKHFPNAPDLEDVLYNASLYLLNSYPGFTEPVPLVPNVIEIGGFHIEPEGLPRRLKKFLDAAKEGVVIFNMESFWKKKDLNSETLSMLSEVFSEFKGNVLWKFEDENLRGMPRNLVLSKWLPQRGVLAHPSTKAVISHCDSVIVTESLYYGIPLICLPIFGEQRKIAAVVETKEVGIQLSFKDLSKVVLKNALNEVLTNKKYKQNAQEAARVLHDRPVKPLELAIFWIEYALRHNGTTHFRSAALDLKFYQLWMLDVIFFVIAAIFILFKALLFVCQKISRIFKKVDKGKKDK